MDGRDIKKKTGMTKWSLNKQILLFENVTDTQK